MNTINTWNLTVAMYLEAAYQAHVERRRGMKWNGRAWRPESRGTFLKWSGYDNR